MGFETLTHLSKMYKGHPGLHAILFFSLNKNAGSSLTVSGAGIIALDYDISGKHGYFASD
jgi:hypothetical protein